MEPQYRFHANFDGRRPLSHVAAVDRGGALRGDAGHLARQRARRPGGDATVPGGDLFCLVVAGYAAHLALVPVHRFGAAATQPLGVLEENYPRRGKHTYRMNSFGFRGPEWSAAKARGTVRGVVIGDSMVFGSGVDDGDTIDAALARRLGRTHAGTPVEILNLGVEGTNLPGYVELYRAATQRLAPDFVVLFLFLPNDLGELEQPSQMDRFGAYSFFTFLFGTNNNPYTLYAMQVLGGPLRRVEAGVSGAPRGGDRGDPAGACRPHRSSSSSTTTKSRVGPRRCALNSATAPGSSITAPCRKPTSSPATTTRRPPATATSLSSSATPLMVCPRPPSSSPRTPARLRSDAARRRKRQ